MKYALILLLGPGQKEIDRLLDLIYSLRVCQSLLDSEADFVIVNDGNVLLEQLNFVKSYFNGFHIIDNPLYGKSKVVFDRHASGVISGVDFVLENLDVQFAIKLDTDVFCINSFANRVKLFFEKNNQVGIAGTYLTWPKGECRKPAFLDWASRIENVHKKPFIKIFLIALMTRKWTSIRCHFFRKKMFSLALKNGYAYGVHIMGGAYAISSELMHRWKSLGYLRYPDLFERSYLGEDSVVTIMAFAAGFQLGCFNANDDVFGVWYRAPELSPQELYESGFSLIHSIKDADPDAERVLRDKYKRLLKTI